MKNRFFNRTSTCTLWIIYLLSYLCLYFSVMNRDYRLSEISHNIIEKSGYLLTLVILLVVIVIGYIVVMHFLDIVISDKYCRLKKDGIEDAVKRSDIIKNAILLVLITVFKIKIHPILYLDVIIGTIVFYILFRKRKNSYIINLTIMRFLMYVFAILIFLVFIFLVY